VSCAQWAADRVERESGAGEVVGGRKGRGAGTEYEKPRGAWAGTKKRRAISTAPHCFCTGSKFRLLLMGAWL
jgi:hypothetical protein